MKEQLELKDGRFMRGSVEVPPRIGDAEQITLLKKREREITELETDGIEPECRFTNVECDVMFECLCGHEVTVHLEAQGFAKCHRYYAVDVLFDNDGHIFTCRKCGRKYRIDEGRVKLIAQ